MTNYKIEQDADGQLWYRGWRLKIIPCGSQYLKRAPGFCHCGQPQYLAFPPYEAIVKHLDAIWLQIPNDPMPPHKVCPEYEGYFFSRHVKANRLDAYPTIQDAIDAFEEQLEVVRKNTWEEVINAPQIP